MSFIKKLDTEEYQVGIICQFMDDDFLTHQKRKDWCREYCVNEWDAKGWEMIPSRGFDYRFYFFRSESDAKLFYLTWVD